MSACLHEWLDRPESDTHECLLCGLEGSGPAPYSPAYQCTRPDCTEPANQGHLCAACERRAGR